MGYGKICTYGVCSPRLSGTAASLNRMFFHFTQEKLIQKSIGRFRCPRLHGSEAEPTTKLPFHGYVSALNAQTSITLSPIFTLFVMCYYYYLFIVILLGRSWQQPDNLILPAVGIEPTSAPFLGTVLPLIRSPHIKLVAANLLASSTLFSTSREQRRVVYYTHNSPSQLTDVRASHDLIS